MSKSIPGPRGKARARPNPIRPSSSLSSGSNYNPSHAIPEHMIGLCLEWTRAMY